MMLIDVDPGRAGRTADGNALAIDAPRTSRRDESIAVWITGVGPNERVEFEASTTDTEGVAWRSTATFTADGDGVVDLTERVPEAGSYDGVEPMGWLWSMTPATDDARFAASPDAESTTVELRARSGGREATRTVDRRPVDPGVERRPVDGDALAGALYEPAGAEPHPGVVVLHGSGGRPPRATAALLASHGYAALALRYFGDPDPAPDEFAEIPLSYVDRAREWLTDRPTVGAGRLGVVGLSRGGELALVLGARRDWVGPVVSLVGSGVAIESPVEPGAPAWVDDGSPVPFATMDELLDPVDLPDPTPEGYHRSAPVMDRAVDALDDDRLEEISFAVENVDGPLLLVAGGDDQVWGPRLTRVAVDRLRERGSDDGVTGDVTFDRRVYEDAGHAIRPPYLPTAGQRVHDGRLYGGTPAGYARADADAWRGTLETLASGLRSTATADGGTP